MPLPPSARPAPSYRWLTTETSGDRICALLTDGGYVAYGKEEKGAPEALRSFGPDGSWRWSLAGASGFYKFWPGANGGVLACESDTTRSNGGPLISVGSDGRIQWEYDPSPDVVRVLKVTPEGITYTFDGRTVRAISPVGDVTTVTSTGAHFLDANIAVDAAGRVLVDEATDVVMYDGASHVRWREAFDRLHPPLVVFAGELAILAGPTTVRALDMQGQQRWSTKLSGSLESEPLREVLTDRERVYVWGARFWAVENGRELWRRDEGVPTGPCIAGPDATIYARTADGAVSAIDRQGMLLWTWRPVVGHPGALVLVGERALVAQVGGRVAVIDIGAGSDHGATKATR